MMDMARTPCGNEHIVKLCTPFDPRSSNSAFGFSFPWETFVVTAFDSAAFRGVLADQQRTLTSLSPGTDFADIHNLALLHYIVHAPKPRWRLLLFWARFYGLWRQHRPAGTGLC
jgi:hypothetical protein